MPLPKKFKFPELMRIEAERRAVIMFGEKWRESCSPAETSAGDSTIAAGGKMLSFNTVRLRSWKDGQTHDMDDGTPSEVEYHDNGAVKRCGHYNNGFLHDPADGSPASIGRYSDGTLSAVRHFQQGQLQDPADGSPASISFYQNGQVKRAAHYHDDKERNPEDGSPSAVHYSELGEITSGILSGTGTISAAKTTEMLKSAQFRRVTDLLAKADQSVIPAGMPLPDDYSLPGAGNNIPPKPER